MFLTCLFTLFSNLQQTSFTVASNDEKARPAIMDSYLGLAQLAARKKQTERLEEFIEKAESEASKSPPTDERENVKVLCRIYTKLATLKSETGNNSYNNNGLFLN